MIRLTEDSREVPGVSLGAIWIGDSADEQIFHVETTNIGAILNVAQDMDSTRGWWHGIEAMHVGLIDGVGNEMAAYYSCVLALHALLKRHNTLVCCHTGTRALTVAMMYLNVGTRRDWDSWLAILSEKVDWPLPAPCEEHKQAFAKINGGFLKVLMEGKSHP